jgi:hypothetical protein
MAVSLAYLFHQLFNFDDAPCRAGGAEPLKLLSPEREEIAARLAGIAENDADIPPWPAATMPWWTRCVVLDRAAVAVLPAASTPNWFVEVPADAPSPPAIVPTDEDEDEDEDGRAAARAAALIDRLDIPRRKDRDAALHWLIDLLREFPHGNSHRAVTDLILEGCSFEELQAAAAVKRIWRDDPGLWLVRRYVHEEGCPAVTLDERHGRDALSWRTARRLAEAGEAEEIMALLCTTWRDAWLVLGPCRPGYFAYAEFVAWQADHRLEIALAEGLAGQEVGMIPLVSRDESRRLEG